MEGVNHVGSETGRAQNARPRATARPWGAGQRPWPPGRKREKNALRGGRAPDVVRPCRTQAEFITRETGSYVTLHTGQCATTAAREYFYCASDIHH